MPIDTIWSDIDYMKAYEDFTIDEANFKIEDMKQITNRTDPKGVHWVPIIDAGIKRNSAWT